MKFLALKDALEKALPPKPPPDSVKPIKPESPQVPFLQSKAKQQRVVGGDIIRTPVNKQAALLVSKAPWWAKPPPEPPPGTGPRLLHFPPEPIEAPKTMREKTRITHNQSKRMNQQPATKDDTDELVRMAKQIKQGEALNAELTRELKDKATAAIHEASGLVKQAMEARLALDQMCDYWRKDWNDFIENSDQRLKHIREFRMAFDSETRHLMTALREVRTFFLDKDHDAQVERLKEFVDLCERLQKLKQSGFLDTVADTMLKLA